MANISKHDKTIKELFVGNCWEYLHNNFHKFNEQNKIKIALTLAQKDMPQEVSGMNMKQIIMMNDLKKETESIRYEIGNPDPA